VTQAPPRAMTEEEIREEETQKAEENLRKVRQIFSDYIKEREGTRGRTDARRSHRPAGRKSIWAKRG
jgi:hypothetical protein